MEATNNSTHVLNSLVKYGMDARIYLAMQKMERRLALATETLDSISHDMSTSDNIQKLVTDTLNEIRKN